MRRHEIVSQHSTALLVSGLVLFGLACFTPDAGNLHGSNFLAIAESTTWQRLGEWPAAWCSLKIIIVCLALCLTIEAVGTLLAVIKLKRLALAVFCLQFVAVVGMLAGGYYFIKAVL